MEEDKKYEIIYCFQPEKKDSDRMKEIEANKLYGYSCWVPESMYAPGDVMVYFNNVEDISPTWLQDYVQEYKKEMGEG